MNKILPLLIVLTIVSCLIGIVVLVTAIGEGETKLIAIFLISAVLGFIVAHIKGLK